MSVSPQSVSSAHPHVPDDRSAALTLALLCAVVFLSVINGTMVNVALPFIGRAFDVSEGTYGWIVTGFSLTFGIFSAVHGRVADILGMRRVYIAGIALFGVSSVLVAMSPTIEVAIALRVLQGAGSAAIPVLGNTIIARTFAPGRRGAAMGMLMGAVGVAASIGPFLGGILVQLAGWRSVFLFTTIVLLAIPPALKLLPAELDERTPQKFDYTGAILLGAGITAMLLGFNVVEKMGFGSSFFGLLVGGLILLVLFGWRIVRAEEPFAPPQIFLDRRFVATALVAALSNATRFGTIVLVPIFLIEVNGLEPLWVGVVLLPGALLIAAVSPFSGRIADRVGARRPVAGGLVLLTAGNLVSAVYAGGSVWGVAVGMTLYGLGFALLQSPLVSAASHILPREHAGVGMGIFMMIFFLGGAFGVALSVTTVELQAAATPSWLGIERTAGITYSNAMFALTGLTVVALALLPWIPGRHDQAEAA